MRMDPLAKLKAGITGQVSLPCPEIEECLVDIIAFLYNTTDNHSSQLAVEWALSEIGYSPSYIKHLLQ